MAVTPYFPFPLVPGNYLFPVSKDLLMLDIYVNGNIKYVVFCIFFYLTYFQNSSIL